MRHIVSALCQGNKKQYRIDGLRGSAGAILAAQAAETSGKPVLCVVPSERHAALLEQDLNLFTKLPVFIYPGYEIPPYTPLSPDPETVAARMATLNNVITCAPPFIFIASAEALLRLVLPQERLTGLSELIMVNEETDPAKLAIRLAEGGYESVSLVQTVGEFSIRGGIFDIFPPGFEYPVRLDFFGDTVESLRLFDPISQRSVQELDEVVLLPTRDILYPAEGSEETVDLQESFLRQGLQMGWDRKETDRIAERLVSRRHFPGIEFYLSCFYAKPSSVMDYLPTDCMTLLYEPVDITQTISITWERIEANHQEAVSLNHPVMPPDSLFLSDIGFMEKLDRFTRVELSELATGDNTGATATLTEPADHFELAAGDHSLLKQHIELHRKKQGLLQPLTEFLHDWLAHHDTICFACHSPRHAQHMAELLKQHGLTGMVAAAPFTAEHITSGRGQIFLYDTPVSRGFDLPAESLHFLSEPELFGERRIGKAKRAPKPPPPSQLRFEELHQGDIVVHAAHGLGVYQGLVHLTVGTIAKDFLQISYQDEDQLYVPVDQINSISKYKGLSDKKPKLDRLGSSSWIATKKKVKQAVWKVAQDLLELYAKRQMEKGRSFSVPDELYFELEESFPFDETPGQIQAINDVLADLTSERPMDRLICGDVGYGKTEVAIRAAFKAVTDNFQVAMMVPTTVLAEQHAATFRERLHGFPLRVESLNRFRSPASQKKIINELAEGKIDIIIGTHRLLSKDVVFKKLGLLIIDEEHRFGVAHKERLKKIRTNVDVLTLTATPIPRTLQLSLLGIRDLSVISSPPQHRRTVKTFIARADDLVIKEAVLRELQRGGQVFLVHNRVQSIHDIALKVQKLAPSARVAVAHGQMPARQLEEIMVRFVDREVDVLVCTTIIESGLDIPNANTIIITRADRLGLAEIYQLRGRVGRSSEQAYAYLLVPSLDGLSKDARQRLRALMDYNDLGGGFKLAMSDLQIRGGGNILGGSQSGHIAAVGYDLYLDLLQKTVMDMKNSQGMPELEEEVEPEINLRISAFIPDSYILDTSQRYLAYRKITSITADEQIEDLKDEFADRYGKLPSELLALFEVIALKMVLRRLKISKFEQGDNTLVFTFLENTPVTPEKILQMVGSSKNKIRFTPDARLIVQTAPLLQPADIFSAAGKILRAFMENNK